MQVIEAAEQDMEVSKSMPVGTLEIASFSSYAAAHIIPAIVHMRDRFSDLNVVFRELEFEDAINAVRDGHCHTAVIFEYSLVPRQDITDLVSYLLLDEFVLLALPEAWRHRPNSTRLEKLAHEDWIVGSRQTDDRCLAERACAIAGFIPRIRHAVDDYDLVLRMVSSALALALSQNLR